jgi:Fe2+ transport system protein B
MTSYMIGRFLGFLVNAFTVTRIAKFLLSKKMKDHKLAAYTFVISSLFEIIAGLIITGTLSGLSYIPFVFLFFLFDLFLEKRNETKSKQQAE